MRQILVAGCIALLAFSTAAASDDWVAESNRHAQIVLDVFAKFSPEGAANLGVDGLDAEIMDLGPGQHERVMADMRAVLAELQSRREKETNSKVA